MEWMVGGQWQAIPMEAVAILTDFFYENENVLYPPPAEGGDYFMTYLHGAATEGFGVVEVQLQAEKQQKRATEHTVDELLTELGW